MTRPRTVAQVKVVRTDDRRILVVVDCGCAWRPETDAEAGRALLRALGHAEKRDACYVPSGLVMADRPVGGRSTPVPEFGTTPPCPDTGEREVRPDGATDS
jgi:hypothetical protein